MGALKVHHALRKVFFHNSHTDMCLTNKPIPLNEFTKKTSEQITRTAGAA